MSYNSSLLARPRQDGSAEKLSLQIVIDFSRGMIFSPLVISIMALQRFTELHCSRRPDSWTSVRSLHRYAVSFVTVLIIAIVL